MLRSLSASARTLAVFAIVAAAVAAQTTVVLVSAKDNTLMDDPPAGSLSNGAGNGIYAGLTNIGTTRRAVLKFDLSSIPANSQVQSVSLKLHCSMSVSSGVPFDLYALQADWGEGTSNGSGTGGPSTTGDATWLHRFYPSVVWTNPGGDFSAVSSATKSIGGAGFYTFNGAGMTPDVQGWITNGATNFGWLIKSDEVNAGTAKKFDSREASTATNRPSLTVTYIAAPTASVVSTGTGCHATNALDLAFSTTGLPQTGNASFALNVANGAPSALTYIYLAATTGPPLNVSPGCNIYLDIPTAQSFVDTGLSPVGPFLLDGSGALTITAGLPADPTLWGQVLSAQLLSADANAPAGAVLSNALTLTFGV